MAMARASRGAKFRTVRITDIQRKLDFGDVLELRKHVSCEEYDPEAESTTRVMVVMRIAMMKTEKGRIRVMAPQWVGFIRETTASQARQYYCK